MNYKIIVIRRNLMIVGRILCSNTNFFFNDIRSPIFVSGNFQRAIWKIRNCFLQNISIKGSTIKKVADAVRRTGGRKGVSKEFSQNGKVCKFSRQTCREVLYCSLDPLIWKQVTISNPCRECFVSTPRDSFEVSGMGFDRPRSRATVDNAGLCSWGWCWKGWLLAIRIINIFIQIDVSSRRYSFL